MCTFSSTKDGRVLHNQSGLLSVLQLTSWSNNDVVTDSFPFSDETCKSRLSAFCDPNLRQLIIIPLMWGAIGHRVMTRSDPRIEKKLTQWNKKQIQSEEPPLSLEQFVFDRRLQIIKSTKKKNVPICFTVSDCFPRRAGGNLKRRNQTNKRSIKERCFNRTHPLCF